MVWGVSGFSFRVQFTDQGLGSWAFPDSLAFLPILFAGDWGGLFTLNFVPLSTGRLIRSNSVLRKEDKGLPAAGSILPCIDVWTTRF